MVIRTEIKVFPKSSVEKIVESDGRLKIYVKSAPDKDKANKDVIKVLAKKYGVKKIDITIIKGKTSRNKVVEVNI